MRVNILLIALVKIMFCDYIAILSIILEDSNFIVQIRDQNKEENIYLNESTGIARSLSICTEIDIILSSGGKELGNLKFNKKPTNVIAANQSIYKYNLGNEKFHISIIKNDVCKLHIFFDENYMFYYDDEIKLTIDQIEYQIDLSASEACKCVNKTNELIINESDINIEENANNEIKKSNCCCCCNKECFKNNFKCIAASCLIGLCITGVMFCPGCVHCSCAAGTNCCYGSACGGTLIFI